MNECHVALLGFYLDYWIDPCTINYRLSCFSLKCGLGCHIINTLAPSSGSPKKRTRNFSPYFFYNESLSVYIFQVFHMIFGVFAIYWNGCIHSYKNQTLPMNRLSLIRAKEYPVMLCHTLRAIIAFTCNNDRPTKGRRRVHHHTHLWPTKIL